MANASESTIKGELKRLEFLVDKDPQNYEAHMEIAEYYHRLENFIEAFSWYNKANKRFPKKIGPYLKLGEIFIERGDFQEAFRMFERATELEPKNYLGWMGISKVFEHFNELDDLVKACIVAMDSAPENPEALISVLQCLVRANQLERAEELTTKILEIIGDDNKYLPITNFYKGLIELKRKLFIKAIPILESIPKDSSKYPAALHNIALAYSDLKKFDQAEEFFKKTMETDVKDNPHAWVNYGLMLEKAKKYENALVAYQKANELEPGIWPWWEHMKAIFIEKVSPPKNHKNLQHTDTKMNLGDKEQLEYSLYLGCVIPNRYPVIEAATRLFMDELGVKLKEMDGASCCPAPGVFRSFDIPTWLTIAARNIAIAEENQADIITLCNGCYGTLLEADHKLKYQPKKKEMVNEHLKKIGMEYKGSIKVKHIIEIMYYDIGKDKLREHLRRKWKNIPVAVHYGCHILKPSDTKPWGDNVSEEPRFFDELVDLIGLHSIPYQDKNMCCGAGGAVRTAAKEVSLDFTREKLVNVRNVGSQAIITCCPFCHLQYDLGQIEVNNIFKDQIEEPFQIPVIYITQLYDYVYGKDPYSIGLLRPDQAAGTPPFVDNTPLFETFLD
ncbi:MAG: CoB--CoM heterodisulfide reductase subunit B [Candidatus Lokiarchaeota archaeon]|nr:CoB--CoM heterodisulfide reductase subunit B [Candidatus Lokiarchaeota archaeon]